MAQIMRTTETWPAAQTAVIGSSLGGFYADTLVRARGGRAVLLNPVIFAAHDLTRHLGAQTKYHSPEETFYFQPEFVDALRAMEGPAPAHPDQYLAVMAKGDEVLDWREMQARYAHCKTIVLEGGDHALSDFAPLVPAIFAHLQLAVTSPTGSAE